jgi:hypothetical protein
MRSSMDRSLSPDGRWRSKMASTAAFNFQRGSGHLPLQGSCSTCPPSPNHDISVATCHRSRRRPGRSRAIRSFAKCRLAKAAACSFAVCSPAGPRSPLSGSAPHIRNAHLSFGRWLRRIQWPSSILAMYSRTYRITFPPVENAPSCELLTSTGGLSRRAAPPSGPFVRAARFAALLRSALLRARTLLPGYSRRRHFDPPSNCQMMRTSISWDMVSQDLPPTVEQLSGQVCNYLRNKS